ncbi:MAG TPA: hypothetical protein VGO06_13665 [Bosea sp. (in: a-proteobacteria)]|uniref:phage tail fiber protein n=1 Tax=Bosea sp. (in: a-proteobacteria) TaxID=1871050 RepID=UPI002E115105|nr:hypothetical protein [Bosea sp. (in: a-proteobacteria)]
MRTEIALFSGENEITGGGYARQAAYLAPENGRMVNQEQLTFGPATVDWGTVTHVRLISASVDVVSPINTARTIDRGEYLVFIPRTLDLVA